MCESVQKLVVKNRNHSKKTCRNKYRILCKGSSMENFYCDKKNWIQLNFLHTLLITMVITNTADTNNDLKTLAVDYVYYLFSRAFIPFKEYFDTVNKIGKIEHQKQILKLHVNYEPVHTASSSNHVHLA